MFLMPEEHRINTGKPTLSELIKILVSLKEKYGDVPVVAAYDGNWNEDVYVQYLGDRIIIGSIS